MRVVLTYFCSLLKVCWCETFVSKVLHLQLCGVNFPGTNPVENEVSNPKMNSNEALFYGNSCVVALLLENTNIIFELLGHNSSPLFPTMLYQIIEKLNKQNSSLVQLVALP